MRFTQILGLTFAFSLLVGCNPPQDTKKSERIRPIETISESEGSGPTVEKGDAVSVLYRGKLKPPGAKETDPEIQFDGNMDDPTSQMPLIVNIGTGDVIIGFDQSLRGMKVGGKKTVRIPYELAYGEQGKNPSVPPKTDLTFELEVLYVVKPDETEVFDIIEDKPGTGKAAAIGDMVEVNYIGTYLTGKMFDDTYKRGQTTKFKLGDKETVIPGMNAAMGGIKDSGVAPMKVGGKRTVIIPPALAFGMGGTIEVKGNQPLKFEIELVSVNR